MRQLPFLILIFITIGLKAQVVINEVGIAPMAATTSGTSTEFIELFNFSSCDQDLSCYVLAYSGTSVGGSATGWTVKIPNGSIIPACGFFLIGGNAGTKGATATGGYPTDPTSAFSPYGGPGTINLNLGTIEATNHLVFLKQSVNPGSLNNTKGQLTLYNSAGIVISSVSYNDGYNRDSYPLSAYTTCKATENIQGKDNIPDPGRAPFNVDGTFTSSGTQGIIFNGSTYTKTNSLSPGELNPGQQALCEKPTATLNGNAVICAGQTISLTVDFTGTGPWNFEYSDGTYNYNYPTSITTSPAIFSVSPDISKTYKIVSVTDAYGCPGVVSGAFSVTVHPPPLVNAGQDQDVCSSASTVNITGATASNYNSLSWSTSGSGTFTNGSTFSPTYTPSIADKANGNVVLTLTAMGDEPCGNISSTKTIFFQSPINPQNPQEFCSSSNPIVAHLLPNGNDYQWYSSNLSPLSGSESLSSDTYYVSYVSSACANERIPVTVVVNTSPAKFSVTNNSTTYCKGTTGVIIGLSNSENGVSYQLFNNGIKVGTASGTGEPLNFGSHTQGVYTVIADNGACTSSMNDIVTIKENPSPLAIVNSIYVCSGASGTITTTVIDGEFPYNYNWEVPSGVPLPSTSDPFVITSVPGTYSLTVVDSKGCKSAVASGSLNIYPSSKAFEITGGGEYCIDGSGVTVGLSGSEMGLNYTLLLEGNTTGNIIAGTGTPIDFGLQKLPGSYTVSAVNSTTGCQINMSGNVSIKVLNETVPTFKAIGPFCQNAIPAQLPIKSLEGITGQWMPQNINTGTIGTFDYTFFPAVGQCATTTTLSINILQPLTVEVNSPQVCPNQSAEIKATTNIFGTYTYSWDVPNGAVNPGNVSSFYTTVAGVYTVTVVGAGCSAKNSGILSNNSFIQITAENKKVCVDQSVKLTAQPTGGTWTGAYVSGDNFDASNLVAGAYTVSYTYNDPNGCNGSADATITVNANPKVNAGSYSSTCTNMPVTLTGSPTGGVFSGDGISGNIFNPIVPGSFTITYNYTDANQCSGTNSTSIIAFPSPKVTVNSALICSGKTVDIIATVTPAGVYSYTWIVPTGAINPGNVNRFSTNIEGSYIVTVTGIGGCNASATGDVIIRSQPLTVDNKRVCTGQSVQLTADPSGGTWTGGNVTGDIFNAANIAPGIYSVTYTYQDQNGCGGTDVATITVIAPPVVNAGSYGAMCFGGNNLVLNGSPAGGFFSGLGVNGQTFSPPIAGSYTVTYTYTDVNGCGNSASTNIVVHSTPTVTVNSPVICTQTNAIISATTSPASNYFYEWSIPAGAPNPGNASSFSSGVAGVYSVKVTTVNGCSATADGTLSYNSEIPVTAEDQKICVGKSVQLTGLPAGGTWSGTNVQGNVFNAVNAAPGKYDVTYIYRDNNGCSGTATSVVTVYALPSKPIFNVNQPNCTSSTGNINITAPIGNEFSYSINGTFQLSPIFLNVAPGNYSLTVRDNNGCNSSMVPISIIQSSLAPVAPTVQSPQIFCSYSNPLISNLVASGLNLQWYSTATGTTTLSSTVPLVTGTYYVSQYVSGCESNRTALSVIVNLSPATFSVTGGGAFCTGGVGVIVGLNGSQTGVYYQLKNNGNNIGLSVPGTGSALNFGLQLTPGNYTVNATSNTSCSTPMNGYAVVTLSTNPFVSLNSPVICAGNTANLVVNATGGTSPYNYIWTPPNAVTNPGNVANFATATGGTYTVIVIDNYGCKSTAVSGTLTVNPNPKLFNVIGGGNYCAGGNGKDIGLDDSEIGIQYQLQLNGTSIGNKISGSGSAISFGLYTQPGIYTVYALNTSTTCSSLMTGSVNISIDALPPPPILSIIQPTCTIAMGNIRITTPVTNLKFSLNGGPYADYPAGGYILNSGTYTLTVRNVSGCETSLSFTVDQPLSVPTSPTFTVVQPVCSIPFGSINIVSPTGPGMLYSVDGINYQSGRNFNVVPGSYNVTAKNNVGCISIPARANIAEASPLLIASASAPEIPCGETSGSIIVTANNGTAPFTYSIDGGNNYQSSNIFNNVPAGNHTVYLKDANGCIATTSVALTIRRGFTLSLNANPNPGLSGKPIQITLNAPVSFNAIAWQPSNYFPNQFSATQNLVTDTTVVVTVIAKAQNGCLDTASLQVVVLPLDDIYIPSAFTPNGDGKNDVFRIYSSGIAELDFKIYNRWGQVVFATKNKYNGWDGTLVGKLQPSGTYVYFVMIKKQDGKTITKKGTVTLIK